MTAPRRDLGRHVPLPGERLHGLAHQTLTPGPVGVRWPVLCGLEDAGGLAALCLPWSSSLGSPNAKATLVWNGPIPEAPCASHKPPPAVFSPECSPDTGQVPTAHGPAARSS